MKINNRTYPGLNTALNDCNAKDLKIYAISKSFGESISNNAANLCKLYNENIWEILDLLPCVIMDMDAIFVWKLGKSNNALCHMYDKNGNNINHVFEGDNAIYEYFMQVLTMIKYAEIETKILPPKTESKESFKCVYSNHSKYPITFINSTWFTNLVKSDAFKVSGHFRLQPYKDENGMPKKKLIWINDFVKTGYTAPARKLKEAI